jgi:hypothetical protein
MRAGKHRPGGNDDGRNVRGRGRHELRRNRLVATADQHDRVDRLRPDHFLGIERHQVAQIHARRIGKRFVNRDRRKLHRQRAGEHHAALDGRNQLRNRRVARIEIAEGIGDADDRPIERVVR